MRKIIILLILASPVIYFTSCEREMSDTIDQDRIYTIYELYYNSNTDKTYAKATFKFGNSLGTLLELSSNSKVKFTPEGQTTGDLLSFKNALAYYEKDYSGLIEEGTFVFTDEEGNEYVNTIHLNTAELSDTLPQIIKGQSKEISFNGYALGSNERLTLILDGPFDGDTETFIEDDEGKNKLVLSANKTADLGEGDNSALLDRRYEPDISEAPDAGGKITGRYRALQDTIVVVKNQ